MIPIIFTALLASLVAGKSLDDDTRIVSGSMADPENYSYHVSLWNGNRYNCGGSIVSQRFILTAAHCIGSQLPTHIIAGAYKLVGEGKRYNIIKWIQHDDYKSSTNQNDIGLLKTEKTIEYTNQIKRIGIASATSNVGMTLLFAGWGLTSIGSDKFPENLRYLRTTIVSNDQCKSAWPNDRIFSTNVCTYAGSGKGACNGDSGSALVRNGMAEGIVSTGGCATGGPDVHTRVAKYYDWIRDRI